MASLQNIPSLSHLECVVFGENTWISFDKFHETLLLKEPNRDRVSRKDNLRVYFKKKKNSLCTDTTGQLLISFSSILRYCFQFSDNLSLCADVVKEVERCLLKASKEEPNNDGFSSPLYRNFTSFYKTVGSTPLHSPLLEPVLQDYAPILDSEVSGLEDYAKSDNFSDKEWQRVKEFELHFQRQHPDFAELHYDVLLESKRRCFDSLVSLYKTQTVWIDSCNSVINRDSRRQAVAEYSSGILLYGQCAHLPKLIYSTVTEKALGSHKDLVSDIAGSSCYDNLCQHGVGLHIFLEIKGTTHQRDFQLLAQAIAAEIQSSHGEKCREIIFFMSGTFDAHREGDTLHKFALCDDVFLNKLGRDCCLYRFTDTSENEEEIPTCLSCDEVFLEASPLDPKNFDILNEWRCYVPLEFQIVLETFLNTRSVEKSAEKTVYFKTRLLRLYQQFHMLLNVRNRLYSGILTNLLTEELSFSYHSANSVFGITSSAGLTLSLRHSDRRLKQRANKDSVYFSTFLKHIPLEYNTLAGLLKHGVCLRECYVVFCIDNLVRLTFLSDPGREDNRSSQVCTLPVTYKGLPKDSAIVSTWHDDNICDNSDNCPCMATVELGPQDIDRVLLNLSGFQNSCLSKFRSNLRAGFTHIWNRLIAPLSAEIFRATSSQVNDASDQDESEAEQDDSFLQDFTPIEDSFGNLSIDGGSDLRTDNPCSSGVIDPTESSDTTQAQEEQSEFHRLGFTVFETPPMISRHPTPYDGRDDDINKLREVLTDVLVKTGKHPDFGNRDGSRILMAPDHKIAANFFKLLKEDEMFLKFVPEFPLLHLRKSKITTLLSAYKTTGLGSILRYMQNSEETDLCKLIGLVNIEKGTNVIRRLTYALVIAIFISFLLSLSPEEASDLTRALAKDGLPDLWNQKFQKYVQERRDTSATFALHYDLLSHCEEVLAISLAERIGGRDGYALLVAAVKSSLPFSYLNGASSYASFCTELLIHHYSAGPFHRGMKESLFTTRHGKNGLNFALDTQREMEHKTALKGFRARPSLSSVLPRLSLLDRFTEISQARQDFTSTCEESTTSRSDEDLVHPMTWRISETDLAYIVPTVKLFLRRGALTQQHDPIPLNMYGPDSPISLSESVLDSKTHEAGVYLVHKYVSHNNLMGSTAANCPSWEQVQAPKELKSKLRAGTSVTVKRTSCTASSTQSMYDAEERVRLLRVKQHTKKFEGMSSANNTCQALCKPDCTKAEVRKADGIKTAIVHLLSDCLQQQMHGCTPPPPKTAKERTERDYRLLLDASLLLADVEALPSEVTTTASVVIMEMSGVKFKQFSQSGKDYLSHVQHAIVGRLIAKFPRLQHLVLVEEKYDHTPDVFKGATREKRKAKAQPPASVSHLKVAEEMLSMEKMDRKALLSTQSGKRAISSFLGQHIENISMTRPITLDIDSDYITAGGCTCKPAEGAASAPECDCPLRYCHPLRSYVTPTGKRESKPLLSIKQRKGEAEMAQADWLREVMNELEDGDSLVSIVSSADIDALPIHLFALGRFWRRSEDRSFTVPVHLVLQKAKGRMDVYNVCKIARALEHRFGDDAAMRVAVALTLGGNDFLPKFEGISHKTVVDSIIRNGFLQDFVKFRSDGGEELTSGKLDRDIYLRLIKHLYCPAVYNPENLTATEVRHLSITSAKKGYKDPNKWMPPVSALLQVAQLIDLQIQYLFTAGTHSAKLPDFLEHDCFIQDDKGRVRHNFGPERRAEELNELLVLDEEHLKRSLEMAKHTKGKRLQIDTPQKGQRRKAAKRQLTSTPRKDTDAATILVNFVDESSASSDDNDAVS